MLTVGELLELLKAYPSDAYVTCNEEYSLSAPPELEDGQLTVFDAKGDATKKKVKFLDFSGHWPPNVMHEDDDEED